MRMWCTKGRTWLATLVALGPWTMALGSGETVPLNSFDLPAGGSVTITFEVDIDSPLGSCVAAISNQGDITGANFAALVTDDPDTAAPDDPTLTGLDLVDLSVSKSNGTTTSVPGAATTYTITVGNAGPSDAVGASVSDVFPAALSGVTWTCVASAGSSCTAAGSGDIADTVTVLAGGTLTYTATGTIDPSASGTLANTANVLPPAGTTECDPSNNSSTDSDTLEATVDLAISKDNGTTSSVPGTPTTYTIVVTNGGPSDAVGASVADVFPAALSGVTWTCTASAGSSCTAAGSGDIAETVTILAGGTVTFTATGTIDPSATGTLANTASVSPPPGAVDTSAGNDSATDSDTLTPEADLAVTKTDDVDPPAPGQNVIYTIQVDNLGPSDSSGSTVTDNLPAGVTLVATSGCAEDPNGVPTCTLGPIAAGGSASYTIEVSVDPSPPASVTNEACVAGDDTDPNPGNDCGSESTTFDAVPPEIVSLGSVPDSGGEIEECETVQVEIIELELTFSEPVVAGSPADPASATNPSNYRLVAPASPSSGFDTDDCTGGTGGDTVIPIDGVSYDAGTDTATLELNGGDPLPDQLYRVIACGSIEDEAGNPLDGGGGPGTPFVRTFRQDAANLFEGGRFDDFSPACDLGAWTSTDFAQVELSSEDADGSPLSGSAHNVGSAGYDLGQCVDVAGGVRYALAARLRVDVASGAIFAELACEFFDQPACGGASLGGKEFSSAVFDTGGGWLPLDYSLLAPAAAQSAACGLAAAPSGQPAYDAYFDDVFLGLGAEIFTDGFESGDTSRWSTTFP